MRNRQNPVPKVALTANPATPREAFEKQSQLLKDALEDKTVLLPDGEDPNVK